MIDLWFNMSDKNLKREKGAGMKIHLFLMNLLTCIFVVVLVVIHVAHASSLEDGTPTPTATATVKPTATATATPKPTATPTGTAAPTSTATATATATTAPTATATAAPTSQPSDGDYWEVDYQMVDGAYLILYFSAAGITPLTKTVEFDESSNYNMKLLVSKSEVGGTREVILTAADYTVPQFTVPGVMTGVDLYLNLMVDHDTTGTLYVQDGIGDVDMSSQSTSGQSPIQVDTYGDGTKDPAGSMLLPIPLVGKFDTSVGQKGSLVFPLIYTTGHTDNTVHISVNKKMDGAFIEGDGAPFAKTGPLSPAPYVGTAGTLTSTGTGNCLGIKLVGIRIDFQYLQVMKMEPTAVR